MTGRSTSSGPSWWRRHRGRGIVVLLVRLASAASARSAAMQAEITERMEALFRASFPELQPHFHPARVLRVREGAPRPQGREPPVTGRSPPGFPRPRPPTSSSRACATRCGSSTRPARRSRDFVFEEHAEGGVIRVGKGKFTVNVEGPEPRVRYWHPEREFKWTPTQLEDEVRRWPTSRSSRATARSSYDDSSSSSSTSSTRAARPRPRRAASSPRAARSTAAALRPRGTRRRIAAVIVGRRRSSDFSSVRIGLVVARPARATDGRRASSRGRSRACCRCATRAGRCAC